MARVQKGYAPPSLLESYGEERFPIIAELLNKMTELLKHVYQKIGRDAVGEHKLHNAMTQLGVNYCGSSIMYNDDEGAEQRDPASGYNKESETAAQPGDRAPEAPGLVNVRSTSVTLSLFGIFAPSVHSVLVFTGGNGSSSNSDTLHALSGVIARQPESAVRGVLIVSPGITRG